MTQIKKSFIENNLRPNIKKEQKIFEFGAIFEPKIILSKKEKNTGNLPEIDFKKCIKCGICQKNCPEGAVEIRENGKEKKVIINHFFCKNCGICGEVCPKNAIKTGEKHNF